MKVIVLEINTVTGEGMQVVGLIPDKEMMCRMLIAFFFCIYKHVAAPILTILLQTEAIFIPAQKIKLHRIASSNNVEIEQLKTARTSYYTDP